MSTRSKKTKKKHKEDPADTKPIETTTDEAESDTVVEVEVAEVVQLSNEETLEIEVAELRDKFIRSAADFENFKKRTTRQFDEIRSAATGRLLSDILEIIDNFERANGHNDGEDNNANEESLRQGMELIFNQTKSILEKYNVKPIEAVGQPFDPNLHEAVMQTPSDEYEEGIITFEMTRGYKVDDRVLRHSKVGVSSGPARSDEKDEDDE